MFYGYLSAFWNSVAGATADTADWFKSLGNAVAGALGNLYIFLFQPIIDVILLLSYVLMLLKAVLLNFLSLPFWVYNFFLYFINNIAAYTPHNPWDSGVIYFLTSFPLWNVIGFGLEATMMFGVLMLIRKTINV